MENNPLKELSNYKGKLVPRDIIEKIGLMKLLLSLAKQNYVLHGSQTSSNSINPHKPFCVNKDGNIDAVYATKNPAVALFHSITSKINNTVRSYTGFGLNLTFSASKEVIDNIKDGYIYIFNDSNFELKSNGNFICKKSITPLFTIKTTLQDFTYEIKEIKKQPINWNQAEKIIFNSYTLKQGIHGIDHVKRVVENAKIIAKKECPNNYDDIVIGAYLHDIGRIDDNGGNEHAFRGFEISKQLLAKYWPHLNHKKILTAIKEHADSLITDDPLIGSIWDADRLDLTRLGIKINLELLSTQTAKKLLEY